jgi:hypothetical protein
VLLNRGNGSFAAKRDYETAEDPRLVAMADLNGDGKQDLAAATTGNAVSVLFNKGGGSFHARLDYRTGRFPVAVAIADVNGDRKRDLVTANYNPDSGAPAANTVSVLLNRPGLCNVQELRGMTLPTAKRTLARVDCRVGNVGRAYSRSSRRAA